jgi:polyphosphate glucokinase
MARRAAASQPRFPAPVRTLPKTLAIDIGGTRLKAGILDADGTMVAGPERTFTPHPSGPDAVLTTLAAP